MIRLILSAIIVALSLCVHSQSLVKGNDSSLIPNSQLRTALKLIEEGKQCAEVLKLTELQNGLLINKIDLKDSIITTMYNRLSIITDIKETYVRDVKLYMLENNALRVKVAEGEKALKKEKRRAKLGRLATVAAAGIVAALIIFK